MTWTLALSTWMIIGGWQGQYEGEKPGETEIAWTLSAGELTARQRGIIANLIAPLEGLE